MRRDFQPSFPIDRGALKTVYVLFVELGQDIHQIHPPSHCLRSAGIQIISEYIRPCLIAQERFPLTEIQTRVNGIPMLVVAWFSSDDFCCGNFLTFRASWTPNKKWRMVQLSTSTPDGWDAARARIETSSPVGILSNRRDAARARIEKLLNALPSVEKTESVK